MAVSKVDIWNLSLAYVNEAEVVSPLDDVVNADLCKRFYDQVVDATLTAYRWNCAKARRVLAQLTDAPVYGYAYQYQLPVDCLRVLGMIPSSAKYEIEGGKLLTDSATCDLHYLRKIDDTSQFDPLLVDVIALELASRIASAKIGDQQLVERLKQTKEIKLAEARTVNAMQNSNRTRFRNESIQRNSGWLGARN